ncbi:MAG: fasciclin domain-containing protein [Polaromonas sp.]
MPNRRILFAVAVMAAIAGCTTYRSPAAVSDVISGHPQLSFLLAKTGLTATLKGAGPFTVFAPGNEAFAKVSATTMAERARDPAKRKAMLTYHVVSQG